MQHDKIPQITCTKCDGTGLIKLPKTFLPTLKALRRLKAATAPELHDALASGQSLTNTNNHLEELRKLGFVRRKRKDTKAWIYYPL